MNRLALHPLIWSSQARIYHLPHHPFVQSACPTEEQIDLHLAVALADRELHRKRRRVPIQSADRTIGSAQDPYACNPDWISADTSKLP